ncbi:MAG: hypothetical protein ACOC5A_01145 [Halanaerobiales bacterium]
MDNSKLKQLIACEVRKSLQNIAKNEELGGDELENRDGDDLENRPEILVLVPEYGQKVDMFLDYIQDEAGGESILYAVNDPGSSVQLPGKVINISQSSGQRKIAGLIEDLSEIYFISPPLNIVKAVTELDDSRFLQWFIIRALLKDIAVNMLFNIRLKKTYTNNLNGLVRKLLDNIEELGVNICSIQKNEVERDDVSKPGGKKLITRANITKLWEQGKRQLNAGEAIVTPLAFDRARELGLKVNY